LSSFVSASAACCGSISPQFQHLTEEQQQQVCWVCRLLDKTVVHACYVTYIQYSYRLVITFVAFFVVYRLHFTLWLQRGFAVQCTTEIFGID